MKLTGGSSLPLQRLGEMQNHDYETCRDHDKGRPTQSVGQIAIARIGWFAVHEKPAQQKTGGQSAKVCPVVGVQAAHKQSNRKNGNNGGDQPPAQVAHICTAAARSESDENSDKPHDGATGTDRWRAAEPGAHQRAAESAECVKEKISGRSIDMFDGRTDVHECQHIEADVNQAAMQIHGGDEAIPTEIVVTKGDSHSEAIESFSVKTEKHAKPLFAFGYGDEPADGEHQNVGNENGRSHRRFPAKIPGQALADGSQGETQICAADVAARGGDADERTAGTAELGAGLVFTTHKAAAGGGFSA